MALSYSVVRVTALNVGDQVAGWIGDGKNSRVFPEPTATGASYASTVRSITKAPTPPGASDAEVLYTVYLGDSNYNNLPVQFTVNGRSDWIVKAAGTV